MIENTASIIRQNGIAQGIKISKEEGLEKGISEGIIKTNTAIVKRMHDQNYTSDMLSILRYA